MQIQANECIIKLLEQSTQFLYQFAVSCLYSSQACGLWGATVGGRAVSNALCKLNIISGSFSCL